MKLQRYSTCTTLGVPKRGWMLWLRSHYCLGDEARSSSSSSSSSFCMFFLFFFHFSLKTEKESAVCTFPRRQPVRVQYSGSCYYDLLLTLLTEAQDPLNWVCGFCFFFFFSHSSVLLVGVYPYKLTKLYYYVLPPVVEPLISRTRKSVALFSSIEVCCGALVVS